MHRCSGRTLPKQARRNIRSGKYATTHDKISWPWEFEQEQFTGLQRPEVSATTRLPKIHFFDAG